MKRFKLGLKSKSLINKRRVLISTSLNDNYIDGALVMLLSFKENNINYLNYDYHIYYHDIVSPLSVDNRKNLLKIIPQLKFVNIIDPVYQTAPMSSNKGYNFRTAYLKLEAFSNYGYDYVVFIDSDILCVGDISSLFSIKFDMAACLAGGHYTLRFNLPIETEYKEINAGFFVIGRSMLNNNLYQNLKSNISKYGSPEYMDQSVINSIFSSSTKYKLTTIPTEVYNLRAFDRLSSKTKIIHWSAYNTKPWMGKPRENEIINALKITKSINYNNVPNKLWTAQKHNVDSIIG